MEAAIPEELPCASPALIEAEMFDFNLSTSPESHAGSVCKAPKRLVPVTNHAAADEVEEDDDEVYLGPVVSYKEQCVSTRIDLVENPIETALTAEQFLEIFMGANAVAQQIQGDRRESQAKDSEPPAVELNHVVLEKTMESEKLDLSVELNVSIPEGIGDIGKAGMDKDCDGQSVIERYKRLTKKNVRSPRRGTYTIDKRQVQEATTMNKQPVNALAPPRQLKKPVGGLQKRKSGRTTDRARAPSGQNKQSKLSSLKPPSGIPNPRTNLVDPVRPSEDSSLDLLNSSSSSCGSNSSVSSIPCLRKPISSAQRSKLSKMRPPKAKQELPGPKKKSPGIAQLSKDTISENTKKTIPAPKPSLLKPSGMATRASGMVKPKPLSAASQKPLSLQKRKIQPVRATLTLEKTTKLAELPTENGGGAKLRRPSTPCTPRGQDKTVIMPRKRILSSASTCSDRTVSRSSCSELDSSVPSTPRGNRRRSCLPTPSKATPTPARRKSTLPTPGKNSPTSTARVARNSRASTSSLRRSSSTLDESPPFKRPVLRSSSTLDESPSFKRPVLRSSTNLTDSPPVKRATLPKEVVQCNIFDRHSPNMRTSTPDLKPIKVADMTRAKKSPAVGVLIDCLDAPMEPIKIPQTILPREETKENILIDI